MSSLRVVWHIFLLAVTLWITASLVFFLSRLLPTSNQPKGLAGSELSSYGLADATTLENVTGDYRKREGLDLPFFYITIEWQAEKQVTQLQAAKADLPWVSQAILWHGLGATKSFYARWGGWTKSASPTQVNLVRESLKNWAASNNQAARHTEIKELNYILKPEPGLYLAWLKLQKEKAPFQNYIPFVKWNGLQNAYHVWLKSLVAGNLGISQQDYQPVTTKLKEAIAISFALALLGLIIGLLVIYFTGVFFALHPLSVFTKVLHLVYYLLDSIPAFLIALTLFGISLLLAGGSSTGINSEDAASLSFLYLWTLPPVLLGSLCISLLIIPHLALQFYRSLQSQQGKLYLRTALAKGLTPKRALIVHALPNALVASLTLLSEVVIGLMAGVLVIEITFSLPGVGSLLVKSILAGDYPVLIGLTLFFLFFRILVVWITDISLMFLDPRMRNNYNS